MRMWPFGRHTERRAAGGFSDAILQTIMAQAENGAAVADASATAALEAACGMYARAFGVADVEPKNTTTAALTPAILSLMARDLIRRGEFVHEIMVDQDGVMLIPCGSWTVYGGPDPRTWRYRIVTYGASTTKTRASVPAGAVVHGRYAIAPIRPWAGIGPLGWAALTGRLHGAIENALADESGGPVGHVVPVPQGPDDTPDTNDPDGDDDFLGALRKDVQGLKGKTVLVETAAAGWGEGRQAAPTHDWKPQRIGAHPPESLPTLRTDSAQAVLAACGVPAELAAHGDAAGQRESWRRFLHGSVQPLADLLLPELRRKLEVPDLALSFDRLMASDIAGRARAFQSMVGGGMDAERAATLAGLS